MTAQDTLNEFSYHRLMIIYGRQKLYKKEIAIIGKGVKEFEKHFAAMKSRSKKIAEMGEKLSKALGLTDKKGNALYDPELIAKWKKRLLVAEKIMNKAKK